MRLPLVHSADSGAESVHLIDALIGKVEPLHHGIRQVAVPCPDIQLNGSIYARPFQQALQPLFRLRQEKGGFSFEGRFKGELH